jgi:hypothetical protein
MTQPRFHWHVNPYCSEFEKFSIDNTQVPPNSVGSPNSLRLYIEEEGPDNAYSESSFYYEIPDEIGWKF